MQVVSRECSLWNCAIPAHSTLIRNSPYETLCREGTKIVVSANITGNNDSYNLNVFQIEGTVRIKDQYAIITEVVDLNNMTNVYADLWDGTNSVLLTADGATLSNAPVGTFFTKDRESAEAYSVSMADECRMNEVSEDVIGKPFTVTQKNGVDTFIRFNYTTNTVLDFTMDIYFTYEVINSGSLTLVT